MLDLKYANPQLENKNSETFFVHESIFYSLEFYIFASYLNRLNLYGEFESY